ncbi:primosomal protein N' [Helicobacter didelphidarum]|uniref:Replication restart protein PriA n=1 Tax=Helicobacter didelphidarum TaxID=2040648 RepID=A0A3D8IIQ2_9HELI|nr:primosomal protein N' [Helicobacter didelphidarum]
MQHILVEIIGTRLFPLTYFIHDFIQIDDVVEVEVSGRKTQGIIVAILPIQEYDFKLLEAKISPYYFTSLQKELLHFISKYYIKQIGITAQIFTLAHKDYRLPNHQELRHLKNHDSILPSPTSDDSYQSLLQQVSLHSLSINQQEIFNCCMQQPTSLIFGATGSGKTEIYFHIIYEHLKCGKQVLLLMPEISLTPQIERRLQNAFPNLSDIWHSKRTKVQKDKILTKLQNGETKIIAGARSALFLPYHNLGLVIVDEEHDSSYKSNSQPKYHARDLAMLLSTKGIQVILGSATPSVKSYYLATKNQYLAYLPQKFYNTKEEILFDSNANGGISTLILSEIRKILDTKKQVIIFVPTRANFKILFCRNCLEKFICPFCAISLSLHQKKNSMICHYCNYTMVIPACCDKCGSNDLSGMRFGTEEVKKQLEGMLIMQGYKPNIAIFDKDYITTTKKLNETLNAFNAKKIDILIGTQMIAKGHDYHEVSLSIVIGIDYMLHIPDYSTHENTLSLLYQVAGRSGRKKNGKTILQTRKPDEIYALWGDYRKVLEYEILSRDGLYPPFCRLALISFSHKNQYKAQRFTQYFATILHAIQQKIPLKHITQTQSNNDNSCQEFEIVGLSESSIPKLKNRFYYHILLRSRQNFLLQKIITKALEQTPIEIVQCIDIDIDPVNI